MGLKVAGARLLLKGGLLNRTNYIGVLTAAGVEFSDSWYARESIALADWTRTNAGLAENTDALNFTTPTANAASAPGMWGMYNALTAGSVLATQDLSGSPSAPALGASFGFDAGDLELAHSAGAVTARGLRKAYESGLVSGTTYLGIFENQPSGGSPGAIDDRVAVAAATWVENSSAQNNVRNNSILNYGVQATDVAQPMWLGLYDASTGGNLLWEDQLDTTPEDPDVGATLSIAANAVSIGFTID